MDRTQDDSRTDELPSGKRDAVRVAEWALERGRVGRYRVDKLLGKGGYGVVLLAEDEQLHRKVAIKIPFRRLVGPAAQTEAYLAEARVLASLDHPHIVPVYDVGEAEDGFCFIVSKFVDGTNLAQWMRASRPSFADAARLIAAMAEALHHAHLRGVVHRDVKPGNILLDLANQPCLTDFGLALREEDVGKGSGYGGTPSYMSPEQARGEGHLVDGRTDIFRLGVVFYELLTGTKPFRGDTVEELLERITMLEVRPPRQANDRVPKELERICLRALSKRATDRYSTAGDMAEDLRHFLAQADERELSSATATGGRTPGPATPTPDLDDLATALSHRSTESGQPIRIVPKGLRSFDQQDADFFLALLPGARDRQGLPESIRFWKSHIESRDTESRRAAASRRWSRPDCCHGWTRLAWCRRTWRPRRKRRKRGSCGGCGTISPSFHSTRTCTRRWPPCAVAPSGGSHGRQEGADRVGSVRTMAARPVADGAERVGRGPASVRRPAGVVPVDGARRFLAGPDALHGGPGSGHDAPPEHGVGGPVRAEACPQGAGRVRLCL